MEKGYNKNYYENHKDKWKEYNSKEKVRARRKKYYLLNREILLNYAKSYRESHRNEINQKRRERYKNNPEIEQAVYKKSYEKNKDKWLPKKINYISERKKTDLDFLIKKRLRDKVRFVFVSYIKQKKIRISMLYGINFNKIIEHLKPFPENMSDYHIDHIRPLCSFEFVNPDNSLNIDSIKQAFAPENHQWLLAEENLKKGGKFNGS